MFNRRGIEVGERWSADLSPVAASWHGHGAAPGALEPVAERLGATLLQAYLDVSRASTDHACRLGIKEPFWLVCAEK